jgi:CBS domain-containing protein
LNDLKNVEVKKLQTPPVTVPSTYTISKIVGVLKDKNCYEVFIPVREKVGTVNVRDILRVSHLTTTKTSSIMKYPTSLSPTTSIGEAARILSDYRLRALPIVEKKELTGALTARKILEFLLEKGSLNFQVKSLTTGRLTTISENDTVAKARNLMVDKKIDHLPVISDKNVVGIVTSNEIVFRLIPRESARTMTSTRGDQKNLGYQASSIMETPLTCQANDKASEALANMLRAGKTYNLVTVLGMIQSIVTPRDYVNLIADPKPIVEIPVYIIGLPEDPFEAEVAKSKFFNSVGTLKRSFPEIEEARSVIKISESVKGKERRRYEVDIAITTSKGVINYTHSGWELPTIYDELASRIKRLMTQRRGTAKRYLRKGQKTKRRR